MSLPLAVVLPLAASSSVASDASATAVERSSEGRERRMLFLAAVGSLQQGGCVCQFGRCREQKMQFCQDPQAPLD